MATSPAYHFISGLPRAGSTLLAALLRQNPACHAGITSPLGAMVNALLVEMSAGNESALFFDDAQRQAMLRGLFTSYYGALAPGCTVFDTNRGWTARIELLAALFPSSKVICCVRHVPWILDSVERLVRGNRFELSKIFSFDPGGTAYSRADGLMSAAGLVGYLRRAEAGHHHHIAGQYLLRYAQEASWREDNRRVSNGDQLARLARLATMKATSPDFVGYWQRHRQAA